MKKTVQVKVNWSININTKDLRELVMNQERLKPVALIIPAKHAVWLEFGSSPAQRDSGGEFEEAIRTWVRRKAGAGLSKKEQEQMVQQVCDNIRRHGLRARPFFRPAFYYMAEHADKWYQEGDSLYDMMVRMQTKTSELIHDNPNAPSQKSRYMPDTGTLEMTMHIVYLSAEEANRAMQLPVDVSPISDDVWEAKTKQQAGSL